MNRNDRALTGFAMLGHATFHTYELVVPIFVVVWLDAFSVSAADLGLVVGASYALIGLGAIPSGLLADRVGSKSLVLACLLGMGGAFVLLGLAPGIATLTLALLAWGLAASIYHPAGLALLSRGAVERGTAFAYHGAAANVGVATGPLVASIMLSFVGWRWVAAALVLPAVLAVVLGLRLDFDERAGSRARNGGETATSGEATPADGPGSVAEFLASSRRLFTGGFLLVFAISVLYGLYYRGGTTFLPEILAGLPIFEPVTIADRSVEPARYVYSGLLLVGGVGQYVGGRLVERFAVERVLLGTYVGLIAVALAFVPAGNAGLVPVLLVAGAFGFIVFMVAPINQEAVSAYTAADVRGLSFGYSYTAVFGLGAIGATVAGVVLTRSTPAVLFVVLAAIAAGGALLGAILPGRSR